MVSAECERLSVEIDRLLPKCRAPALEEFRRIAYAEAALERVACLEAAAGDDAEVLSRVATYEEAMLAIIGALGPVDAAEAASAPAATAAAAEAAPAAAAAWPDGAASDGDDAASADGGAGADAPPEPANEAAALSSELERMTASLKASSLAVNDRLKRQNAKMDELDDATTENSAAVAGGRTSLDERTSAKHRSLFQTLGALAVVVLSWLVMVAFIAIFPKH